MKWLSKFLRSKKYPNNKLPIGGRKYCARFCSNKNLPKPSFQHLCDGDRNILCEKCIYYCDMQ